MRTRPSERALDDTPTRSDIEESVLISILTQERLGCSDKRECWVRGENNTDLRLSAS